MSPVSTVGGVSIITNAEASHSRNHHRREKGYICTLSDTRGSSGGIGGSGGAVGLYFCECLFIAKKPCPIVLKVWAILSDSLS